MTARPSDDAFLGLASLLRHASGKGRSTAHRPCISNEEYASLPAPRERCLGDGRTRRLRCKGFKGSGHEQQGKPWTRPNRQRHCALARRDAGIAAPALAVLVLLRG